jgi:hypothetical protein
MWVWAKNSWTVGSQIVEKSKKNFRVEPSFRFLHYCLTVCFIFISSKYIPTSTTNDQSTIESSGMNFPEYTKSVSRDFAPIFSIVLILFSLILLGFISTLYNHRLFQKNNNTGRHHMNSIYSQLTSANEFDWNKNHSVFLYIFYYPWFSFKTNIFP